jgi:pyridoxal phosphate enzyme (YggS family)
MASQHTMPLDPAKAKSLVQNLAHITGLVQKATPPGRRTPPRLIAISKLHPAAAIQALHPPQDHFGENYIQELQEKAAILPRSIKWTFCGHLQSNKARQLAESVENLWCVSSVDSTKKADALDRGRGKLRGENPECERLRVMVQVNTSSEEQKGGLSSREDILSLAKHIQESCPNLILLGLMTIGSFENSNSDNEENPDFVKLRELRDDVSGKLSCELELSMGMSADFETALQMGSDEVRVGTSIFGDRPPKKEATV